MSLLRRACALLLVAVMGLMASGVTAASGQTGASDDLVALRTSKGDILIELFDDEAPATVAQFRALIAAGGYNGVPWVRIIPDFIVQSGRVELDRIPPASVTQIGLARNVPLEVGSGRLHTRGVLNMARFPDDPDSGTTSFTVLVQAAPHLDGIHTIFGQVLDGMQVVDVLNVVATGPGDIPVEQVIISSAHLGTEAELRALPGFRTVPDPSELTAEAVPGIGSGSTVTAASGIQAGDGGTSPGTTGALIGAFMCGIAAFLLAGRFEPRVIGALGLLAALCAAFGLLVGLVPTGNTTVGLLFFVAMIAFFRLLSRFESIGATAPKPEPLQARVASGSSGDVAHAQPSPGDVEPEDLVAIDPAELEPGLASPEAENVAALSSAPGVDEPIDGDDAVDTDEAGPYDGDADVNTIAAAAPRPRKKRNRPTF